MVNELITELRDLETQVRELRTLLSSLPETTATTGKAALETAKVMVATAETGELLDNLLTLLRRSAYDLDAERTRGFRDAAQADLDRALGMTPPPSSGTSFPDLNQRLRDDNPEGEEPGEGDALVGAVPIRPRPLVGAGARTFAEALEPPRNP